MTKKNAEDGFTLLEVVVAVAITASALAVLYPIFAASPGRLQVTEDRILAAQFLSSELDLVLTTQVWQDLPKEGEFRSWSWSIAGETYVHSSDGDTASDFLYLVTAQITPNNRRMGGAIVFKRMVVRDR